MDDVTSGCPFTPEMALRTRRADDGDVVDEEGRRSSIDLSSEKKI